MSRVAVLAGIWSVLGGLLLAVSILPQAAVQAQISWTETGDAGDLPAGAQIVQGDGRIDSISGSIESAMDADLYAVCVPDPDAFSATTTPGAGLANP